MGDGDEPESVLLVLDRCIDVGGGCVLIADALLIGISTEIAGFSRSQRTGGEGGRAAAQRHHSSDAAATSLNPVTVAVNLIASPAVPGFADEVSFTAGPALVMVSVTLLERVSA